VGWKRLEGTTRENGGKKSKTGRRPKKLINGFSCPQSVVGTSENCPKRKSKIIAKKRKKEKKKIQSRTNFKRWPNPLNLGASGPAKRRVATKMSVEGKEEIQKKTKAEQENHSCEGVEKRKKRWLGFWGFRGDEGGGRSKPHLAGGEMGKSGGQPPEWGRGESRRHQKKGNESVRQRTQKRERGGKEKF